MDQANTASQDILQQTRLKIADRSIIILAIVSPLLIYSSLSRLTQTGWQHIYFLHIWLLGIIVIFAFLRNKISLSVKANYLIVAFSLGAIFGLIKFGMAGQGTALLLISSLYAVIFYGRRSFSTIVTASILILLFIGIAHRTGLVSYAPNFTEMLLSNSQQLRNLIFSATFLYLILFSVGSFMTAIIQQAKALNEQNMKLTQTLAELRTLKGIIPICSYCKNIRNDTGSWILLEKYISTHSAAQFSHGICPNCESIAKKDMGIE